MINIKESNVTVMVKDMDKAIQFYQSIGLVLKNRWENHYAMLSATGITIGLHPTGENENTSGTVSIGFIINEIEEAKELLDKNNISYKSDDGKSGSYVHFNDPDGTVLYFVQAKWE